MKQKTPSMLFRVVYYNLIVYTTIYRHNPLGGIINCFQLRRSDTPYSCQPCATFLCNHIFPYSEANWLTFRSFSWQNFQNYYLKHRWLTKSDVSLICVKPTTWMLGKPTRSGWLGGGGRHTDENVFYCPLLSDSIGSTCYWNVNNQGDIGVSAESRTRLFLLQ